MKKVFFGLPRYGAREDDNIETIKDLINTRRSFIVTQTLEVIGRSSISMARNQCAKEFLSTNADYLFFIDADQSWIKMYDNESNPIDRMIKAQKPFISPPIVTRIAPYRTLWVPHDKADYNVWNRKDPFEVIATGTGFTLISREVVKYVCDNNPAPFMPVWCEEHKTETSDDIAFIRRMKPGGYMPWIMPGIRIGHIGKHAFTPEDIRGYLIEESLKP